MLKKSVVLKFGKLIMDRIELVWDLGFGDLGLNQLSKISHAYIQKGQIASSAASPRSMQFDLFGLYRVFEWWKGTCTVYLTLD